MNKQTNPMKLPKKPFPFNIQLQSAEHIKSGEQRNICICICSAHTFLMTARNVTAMLQNKTAVSDTANSAIQQQRGCPKISTRDSLLSAKEKCTKTPDSMLSRNSPRGK